MGLVYQCAANAIVCLHIWTILFYIHRLSLCPIFCFGCFKHYYLFNIKLSSLTLAFAHRKYIQWGFNITNAAWQTSYATKVNLLTILLDITKLFFTDKASLEIGYEQKTLHLQKGYVKLVWYGYMEWNSNYIVRYIEPSLYYAITPTIHIKPIFKCWCLRGIRSRWAYEVQ